MDARPRERLGAIEAPRKGLSPSILVPRLKPWPTKRQRLPNISFSPVSEARPGAPGRASLGMARGNSRFPSGMTDRKAKAEAKATAPLNLFVPHPQTSAPVTKTCRWGAPAGLRSVRPFLVCQGSLGMARGNSRFPSGMTDRKAKAEAKATAPLSLFVPHLQTSIPTTKTCRRGPRPGFAQEDHFWFAKVRSGWRGATAGSLQE
jgi:hypothetical protein